jgi:hypothetical protein
VGVDGGGTEIVNLKVAGDGEQAEGTVELAHGLVEDGGDEAAVDVARGALVDLGEVDGGGRGAGGGVVGEQEA